MHCKSILKMNEIGRWCLADGEFHKSVCAHFHLVSRKIFHITSPTSIKARDELLFGDVVLIFDQNPAHPLFINRANAFLDSIASPGCSRAVAGGCSRVVSRGRFFPPTTHTHGQYFLIAASRCISPKLLPPAAPLQRVYFPARTHSTRTYAAAFLISERSPHIQVRFLSHTKQTIMFLQSDRDGENSNTIFSNGVGRGSKFLFPTAADFIFQQKVAIFRKKIDLTKICHDFF